MYYVKKKMLFTISYTYMRGCARHKKGPTRPLQPLLIHDTALASSTLLIL